MRELSDRKKPDMKIIMWMNGIIVTCIDKYKTIVSAYAGLGNQTLVTLAKAAIDKATSMMQFTMLPKGNVIGPIMAIIIDGDNLFLSPMMRCDSKSKPIPGADYIHADCDIVKAVDLCSSAPKELLDIQVHTIFHAVALQALIRCRTPIEETIKLLELDTTSLATQLATATIDTARSESTHRYQRNMFNKTVKPLKTEWNRAVIIFAEHCRVLKTALKVSGRLPFTYVPTTRPPPGLGTLAVANQAGGDEVTVQGEEEYGRMLEYNRYKILHGTSSVALCCKPICIFGDKWASELARVTNVHVANVDGGLHDVINLSAQAFFSNCCKCCILAAGHQDLLGTDNADTIFSGYVQLANDFAYFPFVDFFILHPLFAVVYKKKWIALRKLFSTYKAWPSNVKIIGTDIDNEYGWSWTQICCTGTTETIEMFNNGSVSIAGARQLLHFLHDVYELPIIVTPAVTGHIERSTTDRPSTSYSNRGHSGYRGGRSTAKRKRHD